MGPFFSRDLTVGRLYVTKMIAILASALLATSAYATTDAENAKSETESSWKNPINGKVHKKKVEKEKMKDETGEAKAKKTTKTVEKDGKVLEKKVDMSAEGEAK